MRFVAIIGAGELGSSIARTLATHGRVAEIRLIDDRWETAAGKALDIQQAAPIENSPTRVTATSDLTAAVGAAAVLIADSVSPTSATTPADGFALRPFGKTLGRPEHAEGRQGHGERNRTVRGATFAEGFGGPTRRETRSRERVEPRAQGYETTSSEWSGDEGLALIRRLADIDHQAVIVCAGNTQHPLLTRGLNELRLARTRFFGSAPEAVVSTLRAIVALEADVSPSAVSLTVLGSVPYRVVVPWRDATIAGRPATRVLEAAQLARIERRTAAMRPPGPYTLAAAAARLADLLVTGSRKVVCCSAGLDGEFGLWGVVSAVPVLIGSEGIARLIAPSLDVREQVLLENVLVSQ